MECVGVSRTQHSQSKSVKPKMRWHRLRNGAYWQGALKQNHMKQVRHKTNTACMVLPKLALTFLDQESPLCSNTHINEEECKITV